MSASLKQIAQQANVSLATVSKALSGRSDVSAVTRRRIEDVARQLRYRPNLLVRGMQTGRTRTIGVMIGVSADPFRAQIVQGIHDRLGQSNYVMILLWSDRRQDGTWAGPTELEQIHQLVDRRVDGLILYPTEDAASPDYLHEIGERGLPLVAVDRALLRCPWADFVGTDDEAGGRLAAEHLLALGHRRLAHLAGPQFTSTGRERRAGFEAVLAQVAGVHYDVSEDPTFCQAHAAARQLLTQSPRPTAVFTGNDLQAAGLYQVAEELGIKVGRDLSVVGFADLPLAPWISPPLTTIRQHPIAIGQQAATLLLERLAEPAPPAAGCVRRLMPELIVRHSTAPPPPTPRKARS